MGYYKNMLIEFLNSFRMNNFKGVLDCFMAGNGFRCVEDIKKNDLAIQLDIKMKWDKIGMDPENMAYYIIYDPITKTLSDQIVIWDDKTDTYFSIIYLSDDDRAFLKAFILDNYVIR